jgi:hypothetical protein
MMFGNIRRTYRQPKLMIAISEVCLRNPFFWLNDGEICCFERLAMQSG